MTQEIITQITDTVGTEVFGIWFLIGAAFVFFMQAGFAMVETGFTRAKNAGNIIMKNLMDFCIGTIVFIFLGFGLLLSLIHISEPTRRTPISYAVFCLKKKNILTINP